MLRKSIAIAIVATSALLTVTGTTYAADDQCGSASWYGPGFHGRTAASGERFNQNAMTAAHKSLPFGTKVKVVDQRTGSAITVTINDRGPYAKGRIIDLSRAAATELGFKNRGHTKVCLTQI